METTSFVNFSVRLTVLSVVVALGLVAGRHLRVRSWGRCKSKKSLKGQVVIITGANSGLGKATAIELAARGAKLVLACRDLEKGHSAVKEILESVPSCTPENLLVLQLDLESFDSVRRFVTEFRNKFSSLSILINNAGVMACNYQLTVDCVESQMSVNHYGPFLLTNLMIKDLEASPPSRVIFVTSMLAKKGTICLENCDSSLVSKRQAYSDSKLANFLYATELNKRLGAESNIGVYLASPGHVWTNLGRHMKPSWWKIIIMSPVLIVLAYFFVRTPFQGCQSILHCALDDELESGALYRNCKKCDVPKEIEKQQHMTEKLWKHSAAVTGDNGPMPCST